MASDNAYQHLHDLMNERALLHQALANFPAYREFGIEPADYFSVLHGRIAGLIEATHEEHGQHDQVVEQGIRLTTLGRDRNLLTPDEESYFRSAVQDYPLALPDPGKVKRQRREREARQACLDAVRAFERGEPTEGFALIGSAGREAEAREESHAKTEGIRESLTEWEAAAETGEDEGFSLGLRRLSHYVGTLQPGEVLVLGADTNVGKSTFVTECMFAGADRGTPWGYISLEDPKKLYLDRWIATLGGIAPKLLRTARDRLAVSAEGRRRLDAYDGRIWHAARLGGTDADVMTEMSAMARRGAKIIAVDYIGVITPSLAAQDRRNEVRVVMTRLKSHAARLGVALVVVSQLSRPKDKGEGYEPNKHDLKESGDLENGAEYVVLLWRSKDHDFAPVHVKLAKSKNGGIGNVWFMQREMYVEDINGNRRPGSARMREVVKERTAPWSYEFPLAHMTDYEAVLSTFGQR